MAAAAIATDYFGPQRALVCTRIEMVVESKARFVQSAIAIRDQTL